MKLSKLIERLDKLLAEDDLGEYDIDICSGVGGRNTQEGIEDITVSHKDKLILVLGKSADPKKEK